MSKYFKFTKVEVKMRDEILLPTEKDTDEVKAEKMKYIASVLAFKPKGLEIADSYRGGILVGYKVPSITPVDRPITVNLDNVNLFRDHRHYGMTVLNKETNSIEDLHVITVCMGSEKDYLVFDDGFREKLS